MTAHPGHAHAAPAPEERAVRALYRQMIEGWNTRDAEAFAAPFASDGEAIGFDGSQMSGTEEIAATLHQIFRAHATVPYVSKIRSVRLLSPDTALLRAIVGMRPAGQTTLNPALNAHQSLVATKSTGTWLIAFMQTTPAQFHGRPELVQQMTDELAAV